MGSLTLLGLLATACKEDPPVMMHTDQACEICLCVTGLLKLISQGEADVRTSKVRSQTDVFTDIENTLKKRNKYDSGYT